MIELEDLSLSEIDEISADFGGYWEGNHPDHPVDAWRHEIINNDTRMGYWEWVAARI